MKILNKRKVPFIPKDSAYIGRGSIFGNEWSHLPRSLAKFQVGSREEAIAKYEEYFLSRVDKDPSFRRAVLELKKKSALVCYCAPLPCHGNVIKGWLERNT